MFRHLWKRSEPQAPAPRPAPAPTPAPGPTAPAQRLISVDPLGQTIVATIVSPDLNGPVVPELSLQLRSAFIDHPEARNLVLDLQNVEYLDSSCLNMLIVLLKAVQDAGGRIAIASAKHRIEVLFKLTRLDRVFPIQRDVLSAIAHVERGAAA